MRKLGWALTVSLATALPGNIVNAGPDAVTSAFMNRTPTMLDFGMARLEQYLLHRGDDVSVIYNFERDRIEIRKLIIEEGASEETCDREIGSLRLAGGIYSPEDRDSPTYVSYFVRYFNHMGYTRENNATPDDQTLLGLMSELDRKIDIVITVWDSVADRYRANAFSCIGALRGSRFSVERL